MSVATLTSGTTSIAAAVVIVVVVGRCAGVVEKFDLSGSLER